MITMLWRRACWRMEVRIVKNNVELYMAGLRGFEPLGVQNIA